MENNTYNFDKIDINTIKSIVDKERNPNYENNVETWNNAKNTVNNLRSIFEEHNITGQIVENVDILDEYLNRNQANEYITTIDEDILNNIVNEYNTLLDEVSETQNFPK